MHYFLIAGEASGDLHASTLIHALKQRDSQARFTFLGGDLMVAEAGVQPVVHIRDMAFMGFVDVVCNLGQIRRNYAAARTAIKEARPDCLILIDYPSFNLDMAGYAKKLGIPVFYFISPKVWAWKEYRVKKIRRLVDKMLCILPFEVEFYKKHGMEVDYVGNPSVAEIKAKLASLDSTDNFAPQLSGGECIFDPKQTEGEGNFVPQLISGEGNFGPKQIESENLSASSPQKPVIALLPGSRKGEIKDNLPVMLKAVAGLVDFQPVVAGAPGIDDSFYSKVLSDLQKNSGEAANADVPVVRDATFALLHQARAALVTSGTATLETALARVPQVVLYRSVGWKIAYDIMKHILHVRFVSLPNLIADEQIIPEMLLHHCTPEAVRAKLLPLLGDTPEIHTMLSGYERMAARLGNSDAPARAAEIIISCLQTN